MIRQCAILFGCLALGELIIYLTHIPLPSSILGMLLLTFFLKAGWIKLQWVQGLSDFLVANIGFRRGPDALLRHYRGPVLAHCVRLGGEHGAGAGHYGMDSPDADPRKERP